MRRGPPWTNTSPPFNGETANVEGLTYATQESSYLAGCLAGLMTKKQGGKQVVGAVGGVKTAPVDASLAGYRAGAARCDPGITVLIGYSADATDQAKCKAVAQKQVDRGSQVEFNVAGRCGLGTLDAADEAGIWGIGSDVDQAHLHPTHILTSTVKRLDRGVYLAIKNAEKGGFIGGENLVLDLKNSGVGMGRSNPKVPALFLKRIARLKAQIVAGKLNPPAKL
jgi:basic membrane protein A